MNEKIAIIGAGSVGSFLRQRCESVASVQVFRRLKDGAPFQIDSGSLVFITPKLVDLKACIEQFGNPSLGSRQTVYIFIQNGLGICEEFVPEEWSCRSDVAVVRAMLWLGARLDRETGILHTTDVESIEIAGTHEGAVERVRDVLQRAGLPIRQGSSISEVEWKKAYWNVSLNALAALAGVVNQEVLDRPDLNIRFETLLEESKNVAKSYGIVLTEADRIRVIAATRKVGSNRNSMLQDLEARRMTELPWLNERLIAWGQKNDISTANHEEIVREIHLKQGFRHH